MTLVNSRIVLQRKLDPFDTALIELIKTEDEFDQFAKLTASKLRKISGFDRKSFLQLQMNINNLIFQEELKFSEI
jgi:hypothetical protein